MKKVMLFILAAASINLAACSSMRGNVVPQSGPSMEEVYDGTNLSTADSNSLAEIRDNLKAPTIRSYPTLVTTQAPHSASKQFRKLPNPELQVYVFPHLAGNDQLPVPGYYTAFNAYSRDYYALPQER